MKDPTTFIETIVGVIPRVSAAPTWTPKLFKDTFALYVNGATHRLYVYDSTAHAWYFVALS